MGDDKRQKTPEWARIAAINALMAVDCAARRAVEEMMDEADDHLRLIAICGPEDSAYTQAVLAEVERRWEAHQEHVRTSGRVQIATKAQVIRSVRRDVEEGLF